MKFPKTYKLDEIAKIIGATFIGAEDFPVQGLNEIHRVEPGDIVFVDHPKYYDKALASAATVVLINKEVPCPEGKALLLSDDPFRDFNVLSRHFVPFERSHSNNAASAEIGENTIIQPGCFIGNGVKIGKNCLIHPNVIIYDNIIIGDHVTIHSGTVLGADAFYYKKRPEGFDPLYTCGTIVIEDYVTIGSLCSIDRGVTADTRIGWGTKINNLVQIGHDTIIGKKCLIAAQAGISGCVVIEDEVTLWGQVGIASGITLGAKTVLYAQSGTAKSLEGGQTYFGSPAEPARDEFKELAYIKRIAELFKKDKSS